MAGIAARRVRAARRGQVRFFFPSTQHYLHTHRHANLSRVRDLRYGIQNSSSSPLNSCFVACAL